jgi:hypothetical protein
MRTIISLRNECEGEDVFVVGTGTSLRDFDFSLLNGRLTIALNDAVFLFPPSYHLWNDITCTDRYKPHPYEEWTAIVCKRKSAEWLYGCTAFKRRESVHVYHQFAQCSDVKMDDDSLFCNNTVSTAAVVLARKLGAKNVYLLGCDAYFVGSAEYCTQDTGGRDVRCAPLKRSGDTRDHQEIKDWLEYKDIGAFPGGVFNLNPLSNLTTWEKADIQTVLPGARLYLPELTEIEALRASGPRRKYAMPRRSN